MADSSHLVTQLLNEWSNGDPSALDKLLPLIHDELRRRARYYMRRQPPDHTLQPTALVNEAFLRLNDVKSVTWEGRLQFFKLASTMMRHILVDHARQHQYAKRGGGAIEVPFDEAIGLPQPITVDLIALDDALKDLAKIDSRKSEIVELRFFVGLSIEEVAEALKISTATVEREWKVARAWLRQQLVRG